MESGVETEMERDGVRSGDGNGERESGILFVRRVYTDGEID